MRYFHNDYDQMCHTAVMEKMLSAAKESMAGYGTDTYCAKAEQRIKSLCYKEDLYVHFLTGGTQVNLTVITAALRPHQAAVCAQSGHIHVHETGAIEATGHKVIGLPSSDGKITAEQVEKVAKDHLTDNDREHTPQPKLVYISNSTEYGTVYTLQELESLSQVCKKYGYYLFLDGARLGYALASQGNDVSLSDLARLCDVFYIGMTKGGAMFGEAVVICNPVLETDFRYIMKQRGGMLAKGWLLGLQFEALFEEDLYFRLAEQADRYAQILCQTLTQKGYPMYLPCKTNQVFPVMPVAVLPKLEQKVTFMPMEYVDDTHRVIRLCTSWATTDEDMQFLCEIIRNL